MEAFGSSHVISIYEQVDIQIYFLVFWFFSGKYEKSMPTDLVLITKIVILCKVSM